MLVFKTDCPDCKKSKALKTTVDLLGDVMLLSAAKCHKCGLLLPREVVSTGR